MGKVVSFTLWLFITGENSPVTLNGKQTGPHSRSGHFAEEKSLLTLPRTETHIHDYPSHSPASIPTEPLQFLQLQMCAIPSSLMAQHPLVGQSLLIIEAL